MNLALKLAGNIGSNVTLAKKALEMYAEVAAQGNYGNADFSIIYRQISKEKKR